MIFNFNNFLPLIQFAKDHSSSCSVLVRKIVLVLVLALVRERSVIFVLVLIHESNTDACMNTQQAPRLTLRLSRVFVR